MNNHVRWLKDIFNCGKNWGHIDRMNKNLIDNGEQACHMTLLIKDHKVGIGTNVPGLFKAKAGNLLLNWG